MEVFILDIRDIKELDDIKKLNIIDKGYISFKDPIGDMLLTEQKTGFGVRHFIICPNCGNRREKLYIFNNKITYCRSCSPISPYKPIQNSTKGGEAELTYRMKRVAAEHKIKQEFPFRYYEYLFDRPKYMRVKKWNEGLRKMQILENMRFQTIIFNRTYEPKMINYLLNNCLDYPTLQDIQVYIIDWDSVYHRLTTKEY